MLRWARMFYHESHLRLLCQIASRVTFWSLQFRKPAFQSCSWSCVKWSRTCPFWRQSWMGDPSYLHPRLAASWLSSCSLSTSSAPTMARLVFRNSLPTETVTTFAMLHSSLLKFISSSFELLLLHALYQDLVHWSWKVTHFYFHEWERFDTKQASEWKPYVALSLS